VAGAPDPDPVTVAGADPVTVAGPGGEPDPVTVAGAVADPDPVTVAGSDLVTAATPDPVTVAGSDPVTVAGSDPVTVAGSGPVTVAAPSPGDGPEPQAGMGAATNSGPESAATQASGGGSVAASDPGAAGAAPTEGAEDGAPKPATVATVDLGSAVDDTTGLVVAEAATLRGSLSAETPRARTVTPLPAHPGASPVSRRSGRPRVWPVAAVVAGVLLAGGSVRLFWPDSMPSGAAAGAAPSAGAGSGAPSAPASAVAQPVKPVNPNLDACLVGTWRAVSTQVINHFEGVDKMFTGKGGVVLRIGEDGATTEDYNRSTSLTATINGNKYVETLRGVRTSKVQSRNGKIYGSGFSGGPTYKMKRNGKNQSIKVTNPTTSYALTYICSDTALTIYGDEDTSTDTYERVSRTS
jgi:hypothetical protein